MLLAAVALGVAAWWWFTTEMPRRDQARAQAAQRAMAEAEIASTLYRWRDANGNLQVTDTPPSGRKYERIGREPKDGIEVRGNQD
ncbi:MAG: DUF4124 domain-containing protein [Thermomonas sp.]